MDAKMEKVMEALPEILDYTKNTTIEEFNKKYEIPGDINKDNIAKMIKEGDKDKIELSSLVFDRFNRHTYLSYFEDILPNLECCMRYFKDNDKRSLIDSRENIIKLMKEIFEPYDTICVPRIELSEDDSGIEITDLLIYNKEDL